MNLVTVSPRQTMSEPLVSIVTINRNTGSTIKRTIASVIEQQHPFEWVVVDGASSDNSLDELRRYVRSGDHLISEPDLGIADAMNKGLRLASGTAVVFLNAGDAFSGPNALSTLVNVWNRNRFRWVTAGGEVRREDESLLYRRSPPAGGPRALLSTECRIWHAATLCETALLRDVGGFDVSYRSSMDYELWLRLCARGFAPQICEAVVARFYVGGTSANPLRRLVEDRRARAAHGWANPWWVEARLGLVARLKSMVPRPAWAYRLKERLGW